MKNLMTFLCFVCLINTSEAQSEAKWWGGFTVKEVVDKADLIFEGRILTDSSIYINSPGDIFSVHRVLVLKQFKGNFTSDTIRFVTGGGEMTMRGVRYAEPIYAKAGDEAVFFATSSVKVPYGGNDPNTYCEYYPPGVSYVTPCNKNDAVKEVYEPIEKVTGQPYVELRPNNCKGMQQNQQK